MDCLQINWKNGCGSHGTQFPWQCTTFDIWVLVRSSALQGIGCYFGCVVWRKLKDLQYRFNFRIVHDFNANVNKKCIHNRLFVYERLPCQIKQLFLGSLCVPRGVPSALCAAPTRSWILLTRANPTGTLPSQVSQSNTVPAASHGFVILLNGSPDQPRQSHTAVSGYVLNGTLFP